MNIKHFDFLYNWIDKNETKKHTHTHTHRKEKTYENSWKAYTVGSILGTTTGNLSNNTEATILSLFDEENHRLHIIDRLADVRHLSIFKTLKCKFHSSLECLFSNKQSNYNLPVQFACSVSSVKSETWMMNLGHCNKTKKCPTRVSFWEEG